MKEKIKKKLLELSDEKYKNFHKGLCPGTENILGVRVPILRNYAKEIFKENDWKQTIKQIDNEYYEEIMLQGMLIGQAKNEDINVILEYIKNFVPKIDNWAVCDIFCADLKITKKYKKEIWDFIQQYLKSDKEFELRFVVVMILDYYIDEEYLKKIFSIFEKIKKDDYYVKMSVSWAISICLIKYYDETIKYLKTSKIDIWTHNKAIQKAIESYRIPQDKKEVLKRMKK